MTARRIPFGLDRLPRTLRIGDPRLPGVTVGNAGLRLNSEPLPAEVLAGAGSDHAARVAAMRSYLHALCGDYAPLRVRFIDAYLARITAHLAAHRDELMQGLRRYDGLYAPEDWLWSALRPLPRAWLVTEAGAVMADVAFWDGTRVIVADLGAAEQDAELPEGFRYFWRDETLPRSPFRRPLPDGVIAAA